MERRALLRLAAFPALASLPFSSLAHAWPERPLRVIVPFPPGGAIDAMTRLVTPRLSDRLGQLVVIENRGGAGGGLGTEAAMRAGDQHTLLMVFLAHAVNPALCPCLPYDSIADFRPVSPVGIVPNVLVVPASLPWRDVQSGSRRRGASRGSSPTPRPATAPRSTWRARSSPRSPRWS